MFAGFPAKPQGGLDLGSLRKFHQTTLSGQGLSYVLVLCAFFSSLESLWLGYLDIIQWTWTRQWEWERGESEVASPVILF